MESLKALAGLAALLGVIIGIAFVMFVFSWAFRIIGFLVALILVLVFFGYVGWSWITECLLPKKDKGEQ